MRRSRNLLSLLFPLSMRSLCTKWRCLSGIYARLNKGTFGIFRGEKRNTVRLRFSSDQAPYVAERIWMEGQKMKQLSGGGVILSFQTSHLYEVQRWVLSWGEDVRVLAPKALVEEVKKTLRMTTR